MPTTTKAKSKPAGRSAAGKSAKTSKPAKSESKAASKPAAAAKPSLAGLGALAKKLGISAGQVVVLIDAPSYFPDKLGKLPETVELRHSAMRGAGFDLALLFVPNQNTLSRRFSQLAKLMRPSGALWVAWPSKTSGFSCDVTLEGARVVAQKDGLVDNSTHEMDQYWTGARFVSKTSVITEIK
jgi:hypothetical protein